LHCRRLIRKAWQGFAGFDKPDIPCGRRPQPTETEENAEKKGTTDKHRRTRINASYIHLIVCTTICQKRSFTRRFISTDLCPFFVPRSGYNSYMRTQISQINADYADKKEICEICGNLRNLCQIGGTRHGGQPPPETVAAHELSSALDLGFWISARRHCPIWLRLRRAGPQSGKNVLFRDVFWNRR
jgi:hypothetical protein